MCGTTFLIYHTLKIVCTTLTQGFPGMLQLGFGGQQQLQMASMNLLMQQQAAAAAAVMFAAGAASSGFAIFGCTCLFAKALIVM